MPTINNNYEKYYNKKDYVKVYPTEFVVRTFLALYPNLNFEKPKEGSAILDIGFGDGRNTAFLCAQGYKVSGIEITEGIVAQTNSRLEKLGFTADLRVGRNSKIPFHDSSFDYILACHACYYCDEGESFMDNMAEYRRVLKPGGYLIASIPNAKSFIFDGATRLDDGSFVIANDPYGTREGYRLQAYNNTDEIFRDLSDFFEMFSFGSADNNYYGIFERQFWVVCKVKK